MSENKTVYQIDPTMGITEPIKFAKAKRDIVLKQDDGWFNFNVVAMGCMGLSTPILWRSCRHTTSKNLVFQTPGKA